MSDLEFTEELAKSCPRCGKESANKSNPAGRCSSCLKKLAANKKKPGHYMHEHKVADDAIRRQEGRNGTSPKKKSGHGSRKEIIKKLKSEEKKTGEVVSLDRKDNAKGYTPENVRGIKPSLNRGRHHADEKKISAWRKRLKKIGVSLEEFATLLKVKTITPEQQKANKAKATAEGNARAMEESKIKTKTYNDESDRKALKPDGFRNYRSAEEKIESESPLEHHRIAASYRKGTAINIAHTALGHHFDGTKHLLPLEVQRHKKTLKAEYKV